MPRDRQEAERLLDLAAEDGDYPQATDLLQQLQDNQTQCICRCRRELSRRLGGKAHCSIHATA
jgi:hypothetical protein